MKYKSSKYNIKVNNTTIYNTWHCKFVTTPYANELCDSAYIWTNILEELKRERFIVPYDLDEYATMLNKERKNRQNEKPALVELTVITTMKCNMSCAYCFEKGKRIGAYEGYVDDVILYIKNEIMRNDNLKQLNIRWFGGEPLLDYELIEQISKEIIHFLYERNIKYYGYMYSNGLLLTEEISEKLLELEIKEIRITIDGYAELYAKRRKVSKETLDKVIRNIEKAKQKIRIQFVIDKENADDSIRLNAELRERFKNKENIKYYLGYTRLSEDELNAQEKERIDRELGKKYVLPEKPKECRGCIANHKRNVIINVDGNLYRCDNEIGNIERKIGTLKEGITKEGATDKFLNIAYDEECRSCKYLPLCMNICCGELMQQGKKECDYIKGLVKETK